MKRLLLVITLLLIAVSVSGQGIRKMREELVTTAANGAQVKVVERGTAADAVSHYDATPAPLNVAGYRVRIFFDNSQTARASSLGVKSQFDAMFPDVASYWSYETPYYVVMVGNFATIDEALVLLGRLRNSFPKAFLVRQNIPVNEFLSKKTKQINVTSVE